MKEKIFNLYGIIENDIIKQVGITMHEMDGTDEEKSMFLYTQSKTDLNNAEFFPIPQTYILSDENRNLTTGIPFSSFKSMIGKPEEINIFEIALVKKGASANPIINYTYIRENQFLNI